MNPDDAMADQELAHLAELADPATSRYTCIDAPLRRRRRPSEPQESFRVCKNSTCRSCSEAGFVWTSGFCLKGHWRKKPVEQPSLDPHIWHNFPSELLSRVFAHLPTDGICRVRALSRYWNLQVSRCTLFTKECGKFQPDLCALLGFRGGTCWVRVYDSQKWYSFDIDTIPACYASSFITCDAGLACFVPILKVGQPILVCNPLTREWRILPWQRHPCIGRDEKDLWMAQLRVDRETGAYKVILVALECDGFEVYDSETGSWSEYFSGSPVVGFGVCGFFDFPMDFYRDPCYGIFTEEGYTALFSAELGAFEIVAESRPILQFESHRDELYLLLQTRRRRRRQFYQVLKYEEGGWCPDDCGESSQLRSGPPKLIGAPRVFEFRLRAHLGDVRLFVSKVFFLVVAHGISKHGDCYITLCDMDKEKWSRDFYFECGQERPSVTAKMLKTACFSELRWDASP